MHQPRGTVPTLDIKETRQICAHDQRIAQWTFLRDTFDFLGQRVESSPKSFHEKQVPFFGQLQQVSEFRCVGCGRFLAEDVFTRKESIFGVLIMVGVRGT